MPARCQKKALPFYVFTLSLLNAPFDVIYCIRTWLVLKNQLVRKLFAAKKSQISSWKLCIYQTKKLANWMSDFRFLATRGKLLNVIWHGKKPAHVKPWIVSKSLINFALVIWWFLFNNGLILLYSPNILKTKRFIIAVDRCLTNYFQLELIKQDNILRAFSHQWVIS